MSVTAEASSKSLKESFTWVGVFIEGIYEAAKPQVSAGDEEVTREEERDAERRDAGTRRVFFCEARSPIRLIASSPTLLISPSLIPASLIPVSLLTASPRLFRSLPTGRLSFTQAVSRRSPCRGPCPST